MNTAFAASAPRTRATTRQTEFTAPCAKTRADCTPPLAVDTAVGGERHVGATPGPGQPDIGEPALLLERRKTVLLHRPLVREQSLLPARQENRVEFETLGAVQGHQIDH